MVFVFILSMFLKKKNYLKKDKKKKKNYRKVYNMLGS